MGAGNDLVAPVREMPGDGAAWVSRPMPGGGTVAASDMTPDSE